MKVRSRYVFTGATFPVSGNNGSPFGQVTAYATHNTITFSPSGIKLSDPHDGIVIKMKGTINFIAGYEIEFRMRGGSTPHDTTSFTSTAISDANTGKVAVSVSRDVDPRNTGSMQHAGGSKLTATQFFVYSPTDFHTYKIEYDATAGTGTMSRDGVVITSGPINPPDLNRVSVFHLFGVPAGRVTAAGAPLEIEYYEMYAEPNFAVPNVAEPLSDQTFSKGIARGLQRGIV